MTDPTAEAPTADNASASSDQEPAVETTLVSVQSLEALNEAFAEILRNPIGSGVAQTDAQASVLGNVRAAFINQDQIPIPSPTSAARGAFVALMAAAQRLQGYNFWSLGDLRPDDSLRLGAERDANGLLNPMRLFEDDMDLGLYPMASVEQALRGKADDQILDAAVRTHALVLVSVDEYVDWDTWMATFAR